MKKFFAGIYVLVAGLVVIGSLATGFSPITANASSLVFQFDNVFSGSSVSQPAPWLVATFQDVGANQVQLTISNTDLTVGANPEFESGIYFNFNTNAAYHVNNLTFTLQSETSGVSGPAAQIAQNNFKADGDGYYDILFSFSNNNFENGDYVTYLITTSGSSLKASDFAYLSAPGGGVGPYLAAAHLQGGNGGFSAWVNPTSYMIIQQVPEPAPTAFLAVLLGLWGVWFLRVRSLRLQPAKILANISRRETVSFR